LNYPDFLNLFSVKLLALLLFVAPPAFYSGLTHRITKQKA